MSGPTGVYPGSFDPPTIAHLAVAEAALAAAGLQRLDLVISRSTLGKEPVGRTRLDRRVTRLRAVLGGREDLQVRISELQLIADLARGRQAVVMGADKWRQIQDPGWYGGVAERDRALASLPLVLIAPRGDDDLADLGVPAGPNAPPVRVLDLPRRFRRVSSTAVRRGLTGAEGWALGADR